MLKRVAIVLRQDSADPKVSQFDVVVTSLHEDIVRFEVPMNHVHSVDNFECLTCLNEDSPYLDLVQLDVAPQQILCQITPIAILHHNVQLVPTRYHFLVSADIRMFDLCHYL